MWCHRATFLADGRPIFGTTARVFPGFGNILSAESVGNSNYNGLNLTLQKRLSRGVRTLRDLYLVACHRRCAGAEQYRSRARTCSDPTNRRRDRADSLTDKRHVFNMTGVFMPEVHKRKQDGELPGQSQPPLVRRRGVERRSVQHGEQPVLNGDPTEGAAYQRPAVRRPQHDPRGRSFEFTRGTRACSRLGDKERRVPGGTTIWATD